MENILVVDDIREFLLEIRSQLKRHFNVSLSSSPLRAIRMVRNEPPSLVLTTLVMREMDGLEVIRRLRTEGYGGAIVLITRYGDTSTAERAMTLGANDYITQPFPAEELVSRLKRAVTASAPIVGVPLKSLRDGIQTNDPGMIALLELAAIAADTDARILILGETGTGKELLARAIHRHSSRVESPFVAINCAAIQDNLLESELFGHEKGSFTGAHEMRVGRFEEAGTGTLFLDEIGELPLALQAKLLRVFQSGEYSRVGGTRTLRSRARIITATNRDLRQYAEAGHFRMDLFFRLNVVSLTLPPLRERPGDVQLLAHFFLHRFQRPNKTRQRFSDDALKLLMAYDWPGNIRELEHLVERSSILVRTPVIGSSDLPNAITRPAKPGSISKDEEIEHFAEAKRLFETDYFSRVLKHAQGNYAMAARLAGIERTAFYRKCRRLLADKNR